MLNLTKTSTCTPPRAKVVIDPESCTGCGLCVDICPFGLPVQTRDGTYTVPYPDRCTECSACQRNCPVDAIQLQEQKGCGCLWDVLARKHAQAKPTTDCGCPPGCCD